MGQDREVQTLGVAGGVEFSHLCHAQVPVLCTNKDGKTGGLWAMLLEVNCPSVGLMLDPEPATAATL